MRDIAPESHTPSVSAIIEYAADFYSQLKADFAFMITTLLTNFIVTILAGLQFYSYS